MKNKKNKNYHKFNNRNIKKEKIVSNENIVEIPRDDNSYRKRIFKTKLFYMLIFITIGILVFITFYFALSRINKPVIYFDKDKKEVVKYNDFHLYNGKLKEVNESNYYNKNGYLYFLDNNSYDDFNLYFQFSKLTKNTNKEGNKKEDKDSEDKNIYNKYEFFLGYDLENKNVKIKDVKYNVLIRYEFEEQGELIEERSLDLIGKENKDYILNSEYNRRSQTLKLSKDYRNRYPYLFIKVTYKKTYNNLDIDQVKYIKIALSKDYKPIIQDANLLESKKDEN